MKDKLNITIKVADLAPLGMSVPLEGEEDIRLAEYYVNRAWDKWMQSKPRDKESKDILGMVAIHFTKLYIQEVKKNELTTTRLQELERHLDKLLLNIE
ncbi:MAG: cell division protein ZapA [Muribaculum sp.]|nr:cell division protein ZapA [Muribaculaceae bacterium]MCM1080311.1 cell division protein ZapA [Muribaculum sp.]